MVTMTNIDFVTREVTRGYPDTQWWVQLSTAIVFGLIFATILTLIVTPSALMLKENVVNWYRKKLLFNFSILNNCKEYRHNINTKE